MLLVFVRGAPKFVRSDNSLEFIAKVLRKCLGQVDVETLCIALDSPSGMAMSRALMVDCEMNFSIANCS